MKALSAATATTKGVSTTEGVAPEAAKRMTLLLLLVHCVRIVDILTGVIPPAHLCE